MEITCQIGRGSSPLDLVGIPQHSARILRIRGGCCRWHETRSRAEMRSSRILSSEARILGSRLDTLAISMTTEHELREKLRKISALFEGATTIGERHAAAAAIDRVRKALAVAARTEQPVETQFTLSDQWSRRLFTALCRRYGLEPYRYRRQRHTTVVVRAPRSFINNTLWPEFLQIKDALDEYLNEATERIIREEVYGNSAEAPERAE